MRTQDRNRRASIARSQELRSDLVARFLRDTILVDQALLATLRLFRRIRTAIVLGFVSDATLERLGEHAYGETTWYRPHGERSWPELFAWERAFLERHAPSPPARVLIGGAGAGREAVHLAQMGYDVTAFDPIPFFVTTMHREIPPELGVDPWHGRYETLPLLGALEPGSPSMNLAERPPFDFGIMGWTSLSHVLDAKDRLRALQAFAAVVDGPILLSVFTRDPADGQPNSRLGRLRQRLPGRNKDFTFDFQISTGVYRTFIEEEIVALCERAGLVILESNIPRKQSHSGWVVVKRKD